MKAKVIKIGDGLGVILPPALIEQLQLSQESTVELEINEGTIAIKQYSRQGWAEAAKQMNAAGDDNLLIPERPCND
jgi:antitoxin MazE